MTRIDRITHMEALFDKSEEVVRRLETALEDFAALQPAIAELEAYYTSAQWRKDFEADEAGKLPKDLKRGVLSEDGLWNLLSDYGRLKEIEFAFGLWAVEGDISFPFKRKVSGYSS